MVVFNYYQFFYSIQTVFWFYYNWHKLLYSLKFMHRNHLSTPPSKKLSKHSWKVLFLKASPQPDGLICTGPLMEQICLNEPQSSLS